MLKLNRVTFSTAAPAGQRLPKGTRVVPVESRMERQTGFIEADVKSVTSKNDF